jgi:glutathione peroxidase-family protein
MKNLILCASFLLTPIAVAAPQIGKSAPTFKLPANDGKTYDLEKLKGKYVVLEWFNNDCPYVDKHYNETKRNMQSLQKKWIDQAKSEGKELVWLAIASSPEGTQGYLTPKTATEIKDKERKANMDAILLDHDGTVGRLYEAKTTPHMYIIDPAGALRYAGLSSCYENYGEQP